VAAVSAAELVLQQLAGGAGAAGAAVVQHLGRTRGHHEQIEISSYSIA